MFLPTAGIYSSKPTEKLLFLPKGLEMPFSSQRHDGGDNEGKADPSPQIHRVSSEAAGCPWVQVPMDGTHRERGTNAEADYRKVITGGGWCEVGATHTHPGSAENRNLYGGPASLQAGLRNVCGAR